MDGCHVSRSQRRCNKLSPLASDAELFSQESLGGGSSQADDHLRACSGNFRVQPWTASLDFRVSRLLMDAPLAALVGSPVEMLHHVGHVDGGFVDSGYGKCLVENSSGRTDERMAGQIFFVAG